MPDPLVARLRAAGCVFAEDEAGLLRTAAADPTALELLVERRIAGEPLEHLLGWASFCGLRIAVGPGVFVPRRRTELLVRQAVPLVRAVSGRRGSGDRPAGVPVLVDLCCGCAAVGVALAVLAGPVELHAADVDPAAAELALRNVAGPARAAGSTGEVHVGDLYRALPERLRGRVDVLVVNAPYVPTEEIGLMPAEARLHEPAVALDGGADGLDVVRRVAAQAGEWLAPGGHLLVETSRRQAPTVLDLFRAAGLHPDLVTDEDLAGTAVVGRRSGPPA